MLGQDTKKVGYIDESPADKKHDFVKRAQEELNENPESRNDNIRELKERILAEENLKCPTYDAFLLRFLRARKFDVNRAFKVLQQHYMLQAKFPSLFENYSPSKLSKALIEKIVTMLPYRDQDGRRVMIIRIGIWDPAKCSIFDIIIIALMLWDCVSYEDETQINGGIIIVDLTKFSFVQLRHGTPTNCRIFAALLQDLLPVRFKGLHFLFNPAIFYVFFMIFRPFLSTKIRSRVHFHGHNIKSLHHHVYSEFLPLEYDGQQASVETAYMKQTQFLVTRGEEIANAFVNFGYNKGPQR